MHEPAERLTAALSDRYHLERELGQGGMATVYLAEDLKHDRKVAIKVLRPELAAVIGAERFLSEIKTTANLQHPHILPLFDSGAADSFLFYVMPFIDGESLRDRLLREKQLPIVDAVRIATEVAGALDYAHRHNVIHRDIKPENILLHDGRALVADFGIALAASKAGGTRMTETGMSLGTPTYMSPEQAMGEREITARSDVYALGCVTYEMLVGDPPFLGGTAQAIVAKVMTEKPAAPSRMRDTIPAAVEDAVLTALEKLPADRFATAAGFAAALAGGATSRASTRSARAVAAGAGPWRRISAVLGAVTLGLIALAAWALSRSTGAAGPAVFDAALPDSARVTFAATTETIAYGTALRNLSVSPAGEFVVYTAKQDESTILWYRNLRDATTHPITGTLGATVPRVSPEGTRVAFLVSGQVMVVPIAGGEPRRLLEGRVPVALEWISPTLLMAAHVDGYRLSWLDPEGGQAKTQTIQRCTYTRWIPEDRQLMCSLNGMGSVTDPVSGERWTIHAALPDGSAGQPVFGSGFQIVDGRYLLYMSVDGDLMATTYDRARHTAGRPVSLLSGIRVESFGGAQFDLTADGTLIYAPGPYGKTARFVRRLRDGAPEPLPVEAGAFERYDLSRDRRWLAAVIQTSEGQELRIHDLRDGQRTTWLRAEVIRHPLWSPHGDRLIVWVQDSSRSSILLGRPGSGIPPDTLYGVDAPAVAPDMIDYHASNEVIAGDWTTFVTMRFDPTLRPVRFDSVATDARFGSISPDGRHFVYSTSLGASIVVTSYPVPGRRWQLSAGGVEPLWLSSTEVLYRSGVVWYLIRINPVTGETLGTATYWGRDPRFSDTSGWSNRPSHDGGIIYLQGPEQTSSSYMRVIPHWVAQMKAAVDAANR